MKDSGLEIARLAIEICQEKKAWQPIVLKVDELTSICSYIVIVSQPVKAQVKALAKMVESELSDNNFQVDGREGFKAGEWILLDYGEVLINILHQPERDFYRLEEIWRKAPKLEFEEQ
ncbi:MAG: ribosome silencing factor [Candidatus Caenarcaniphilales bacterium]|nr:ribosome silencing factor [Candidatus Caenarcaniphilales bacterium]